MSNPVVLLVEDDQRLARRIASEIETRVIGSHCVHAGTGEAAVLWAAAHDCEVCVLDYDLPGIDGLETLSRIRQRKPNLPVIMMSGAASEQVAVAAFRARVADFVPKRPGFEQTLAGLVQRTVTASPRGTVSSVAAGGPAIPANLAQPTYENRLRVIGRQLDIYGYRTVTILEVAGGFLARGTAGGSRTPEALEFPEHDFPQMFQNAYNARGEGEHRRASSGLLPTGYEDSLRALGHRLDNHFAEAVTITELDSFVAVGGVAKVETSGQTGFGPLQWLLRSDDITFMLDEAWRRRAPAQESRLPGFLRRNRE